MRVIQESELPIFLREKQGQRSDAEFAKLLGVHPNTLWNIRNGKSRKLSDKLLKALGVTLAYASIEPPF